jgi:hypothetical protein
MDSQRPGSNSDDDKLTVVGVGASAGGLEALTELLERLSPDSSMAFVVIQHLDPRHESVLPDLLSRKVLAMSDLEREIRDLREKTNRNLRQFLETEIQTCRVAMERAHFELSLGKTHEAQKEFGVVSGGIDVVERFLRKAAVPMADLEAQLADLRASLESLRQELETAHVPPHRTGLGSC